MERINLKFLYCELSDENKLIEWLMNKGLIASKYVCCVCDDDMKLQKKKNVSDGCAWRCQKYGEDKHDVKRSVRKGTWFEESKLSMHEILILSYMWCVKISAQTMIVDMKVSSRTVTNWQSFCREICVEMCVRENEMLGGPGIIVEIDESKFGKRKYNRGKRVEGKWVFGGIERGMDKCFMKVVQERSKNVLLDIIKEYVRPGTIVMSDCWRAYACLEDEGYMHLTVNHSVEFKNPDTGAHTNSIEGTWAAIKRNMGGSHCQGRQQFDSYLFEYMCRRKNKIDKPFLFNHFLDAVKAVYPPSEHD